MTGKRVLVTGATGYIASRLIPALIGEGLAVRVTSRHPERVGRRHPATSTVASDLLDPDSLRPALAGVDVAYYLVHSMGGSDFEASDRDAARNFAAAAADAGVARIVYLGGLGRDDDRLSSHLRSRREVGRILAEGTVEVVELRAAIVIGSGSIAFEMVRYLTERLPVMVAPRWLETRIQPIGEDDLVRYLVGAATLEPGGNRIVGIGGKDVLTYRQMILGYARLRGLRRAIVGVPVLTPSLSSHWVKLVTPMPFSVAKPLIDGLRNEVVVTDDAAARLFPGIEPGGYSAAVTAALKGQIRYLDAASAPGKAAVPGSLEGMLIDRQWVPSAADATRMSEVIHAIGGDGRWYPLRLAWWMRARLDDVFGGTGLKWSREPGPLTKGARVDWWTVEAIEPHRLLLKAELKVPGEAWLEWRVVPLEPGCELRQTAYYRPKGLIGHLYWLLMWPFHAPIFRLMAIRLAQRAELESGKPGGRARLRFWPAGGFAAEALE